MSVPLVSICLLYSYDFADKYIVNAVKYIVAAYFFSQSQSSQHIYLEAQTSIPIVSWYILIDHLPAIDVLIIVCHIVRCAG